MADQRRRKMPSRRKGKEPMTSQERRPPTLAGWISDEDLQIGFVNKWKDRKILTPKFLSCEFFRSHGFQFQEFLVGSEIGRASCRERV